MNKQVRLYNLMFPFWLLVFVPMAWLAVLPLNFLIDSLVLLLAALALAGRLVCIVWANAGGCGAWAWRPGPGAGCAWRWRC